MIKIKIIETAAVLVKSDVLTVTSAGSFYPSSADMSSPALIYFPDTWRLPLWALMGEACSKEQHLLSKSWCSSWEHMLCSLHCIWPCFSASSHSYHFGSRFLVTTWSHILQLPQTGAGIWAQLCSCPECWVHAVGCWWYWPKHKFTGYPHGMKWMIMQTFFGVGPQPGESYVELWKRMI